MADVIYLLVIFVFFGLAALFVVACDKIIGPDQETLTATSGDPDGRASSPDQPVEQESWRRVNGDDIAGLLIAVLLLGYLVFALIAPEKL